ncbi:sce7725 family protein [Stutzerimonas nitrititolerans]|uniref:sce7725 family protein n=1 Tax=Stutzerimonas nitrititolerans TaxID=2482751 RepID=UPI0028A7E7BF|nr:sce7725 family protein [Stutzerimonas nitrititolerans]
MYYPILRGKLHELSAIRQLASLPVSNKCRPLLEPVNVNLNQIAACIDDLYSKGITPYVVINPALGEYRNQAVSIYQSLHQNPRSSGKFLPCVKILNSFDTNAVALLQNTANAAAYLVSDISPAAIQTLNAASCTFVNPLKVDATIIQSVARIVPYLDSFAKQRRNADYPQTSFYSNLHFNYRNYPNAIGVGDFTIMGEEYSEAGGPAYVVAIHMSHVQHQPSSAIHVRHFCSTIQPASPANPGGKFLEALDDLIAFDNSNPRYFDRTWGLAEFRTYHTNQHFPGLGVVKQLSVEHHMETICNFI